MKYHSSILYAHIKTQAKQSLMNLYINTALQEHMTRKSSVQNEHVSSDESEGNLHLKGLTPQKRLRILVQMDWWEVKISQMVFLEPDVVRSHEVRKNLLSTFLTHIMLHTGIFNVSGCHTCTISFINDRYWGFQSFMSKVVVGGVLGLASVDYLLYLLNYSCSQLPFEADLGEIKTALSSQR